MGIVWSGEIWCGEKLAQILKFNGKIWDNISRSWHKNKHTHQILPGKLCLGIKPGGSGSTVQYVNNSTTTRASYCSVKQDSYLEHDVVLNNMWC